MRIAQQSVHGLDVVFDERATRTVTAEMGQGELAAAEGRRRPVNPGALRELESNPRNRTDTNLMHSNFRTRTQLSSPSMRNCVSNSPSPRAVLEGRLTS